MAKIFEVHTRKCAREKAEVDTSADAFLMATIDERLQAFEFVVSDGKKELVDNMILKDPIRIR